MRAIWRGFNNLDQGQRPPNRRLPFIALERKRTGDTGGEKKIEIGKEILMSLRTHLAFNGRNAIVIVARMS